MHDCDLMGNNYPESISFDGYHYQILKEARERNERNFDSIMLVVGEEGAGKTRFALRSALGLNWKNLSIDNCVFNSNQFMDAVDKAEPNSVIIYDEADEMASHWADKIVSALKRKMKRIRKKNLFIFLITPDVFELQKYFVIHRTIALFNVYADENLNRGFWEVWNRRDKRLLYIKGKRFMDIRGHKPTRKGRFLDIPKWYPISMSDYEAKKDAATEEIQTKALNPLVFTRKIRVDIARNIENVLKREGIKLKVEFKAEMLGVHKRTFYQYLSDEVETEEGSL